jgi:sterol desaturase/sphingolipid hydroxylase (fatty acid hydroxylase superfamily)
MIVSSIEQWWSDFVVNFQHHNLAVWGGFVSMMISFWGFCLIMLLVDLARRPRWFFSRRLQPTRPFSVAPTDYNPVSLTDLLINVSINQWFVILPTLWAMQSLSELVNSFDVLPWRMGIQVTPTLPSVREVVLHGILGIGLVEIFFYFSHRLLHTKLLYARIHKVHHRYRAPTAMAAIYAHPLEAFFANALAVMGPSFLIGFHLSSWMVGVAIGWFETCQAHSGYPIVNRGFHDFHHSSFNSNFGAIGLLDRLFGTDKSWREHQRQKAVKAD